MTHFEWKRLSAVMFWINHWLPLTHQAELLQRETGLSYTEAFDAARRYREKTGVPA